MRRILDEIVIIALLPNTVFSNQATVFLTLFLLFYTKHIMGYMSYSLMERQVLALLSFIPHRSYLMNSRGAAILESMGVILVLKSTSIEFEKILPFLINLIKT